MYRCFNLPCGAYIGQYYHGGFMCGKWIDVTEKDKCREKIKLLISEHRKKYTRKPNE